MKIKSLLFAIVAAILAGSLQAEVFYWKHDQDGYYSYGDTNSWIRGDQRTGETPDVVPGPDDYIHYMRVYQSYGYYNLDNTTYTNKGFSFSNWTEDWGFRHLGYKNGTMVVTGCYTNLRVEATIEENGKLVLASTCGARLGYAQQARNRFWIKDTGALEVGGLVELGDVLFDVRAGGEFKFCPASLAIGQGANYSTGTNESIDFINSGTIDLASGLHFTKGPNYNGTGHCYFSQNAGTLTLSSAMTKADDLVCDFAIYLNGGTVKATVSQDLAIFKTIAMTNEDSSATVEVADGQTLNFGSATFASGTTLTKTGAGVLTLGDSAPATLAIESGRVQLDGETALGTVTLGEAGVLTIASKGVSATAISGLAAGKLVIDSTNIPNGVRVFTSTNAALVDSVKDLATVSSGQLVKVDNSLVLVQIAADANVFTASGEKDFSDATAWSKGAPTAGANLVIMGPETTCVLKKADVTDIEYGSIIVAGGATLKVAEKLTLPVVNLAYDSKLLFAASMTLEPGIILASADAAALPVVEVAKDSNLSLQAGFAFKNVSLKLRGKLQSLAGALYLGTADADETTYFNLDAENSTIDLAGSNTGNCHYLHFANPTVGGRVVVTQGITLKGCIVTSTWNQNFAFAIAANNPTDEVFDFVLDQTTVHLRAADNCIISGGAQIVCKNEGGFFDTLDKYKSVAWIKTLIEGQATLRFEGEGAGWRQGYTRHSISYVAATDGAEQMTFKDGASWQIANCGNTSSTSVFGFDDGYWDLLDKPYYDSSYWSGKGVAESELPNYLTEIFAGLKSVRVGAGKFVGIRSYHCDTCDSQQWNRIKAIANVPVTGEGGSLFVTNATPGYSMAAIMICGSNTATGEAWAAPSADGSTLYFANGANWAGTVRGDENIAFTNLTSAASPATVTFGGIKFTGRLPIRVWKGASAVSDYINISSSLVAGKKGQGFLPVSMTGEAFAIGDRVTVGKCPAAALPADYARKFTAFGWRMETAAIDGDADNVTLALVYDPIPFILTIH